MGILRSGFAARHLDLASSLGEVLFGLAWDVIDSVH